MARFFYTLAINALLPWAMLHLLWRARHQPEYLQHWGERFGFYGAIPADAVPHAGHFIPATGHSVPAAPTFQTFWIHAVSVGETRAAQPLIAALREQFPACRILLTHMTPTGRAASEGLFGDSVERVYLPYDTPWAVRRFLRHFRPTLGLIMETELWPNLIAACHGQGLPLLLVNARLSEKSARRYARFPRLARQALEQLTAISAIGNDDAERLRALGAPTVTVTGNMKFDMTPPAEQVEVGEVLRARLGTRPVFLCASTREGEEALILDAWSKVGAGPSQADAPPVTASGDFMGGSEPELRARGGNKVGAGGTATLLVIVPRHPQRFAAVAQLVTQRGLKMQRRSDGAPVAADTQVWLGDSMGEMFAYYAAADVAFVGGSLLDFGCQNLIEPCAVGVPVLIGPSTFNFAEAARAALAAGAARQIGNAAGLVEQAQTIMADEACKQAMGEAGRAFAARHRGATRRTMALILALARETTAPA